MLHTLERTILFVTESMILIVAATAGLVVTLRVPLFAGVGVMVGDGVEVGRIVFGVGGGIWVGVGTSVGSKVGVMVGRGCIAEIIAE